MAPRKNPSDPTPSIEELPESLRKAIVNLMAKENLDKNAAYDRAATLIDSNSDAFEKQVQSRANNVYKSRFMTEINKTRAAWKKELDKVSNKRYLEGIEGGMDFQRKEEHSWHIPCAICGQDMFFSSMDQNFDEVYELLKQTFGNWHHVKCP